MEPKLWQGNLVFIQRGAPKVKLSHHIIHIDALSSKQLSSEFNKVSFNVISIVHYMKTRPLKARLLSSLCEEAGVERTALLFHSEDGSLSSTHHEKNHN